MTPLEREVVRSTQQLVDRGFDRAQAARFSLNRHDYVGKVGKRGDGFISSVSEGACVRVKGKVRLRSTHA